MRIQEHVSLKELTTMKIGGAARYFCSASTREEVREAVFFAKEKGIPVTILGGGSNVLIANSEINALVLKIEIKGIEWVEEKEEGYKDDIEYTDIKKESLHPYSSVYPISSSPIFSSVLVIAGAGESWDSLVAQAVARGLWGIENLSGIPGTVGAAPIQNIGAYGTEVKETIEWVEVLDTGAGTSRKLTNAKCRFAYRDSVFKKPEGKSYIALRVALRLRRKGTPNLEYKDLKERFKIYDVGFKKEKITLAEIRQAILKIRSRKFPDLQKCGAAGSFFKNPILPKAQYNELKKKFPDLPGFEVPSAHFELKAKSYQLTAIKVPLAWILDNVCGLRGFKKGNVALFERQPIVLVQNGLASSEEIDLFAKGISDCVKEKTGIAIEWEVQKIQ